jgi:hypothetical protein
VSVVLGEARWNRLTREQLGCMGQRSWRLHHGALAFGVFGRGHHDAPASRFGAIR